MKRTILVVVCGLGLSTAALAQTFQVCVVKTVGTNVTQSCMTLPGPVVQSLKLAAADDSAKRTWTALTLSAVNDFILGVIDKYPSPALAKIKAAQALAENDARAAAAAADAAKAAALPSVPAAEPQ